VSYSSGSTGFLGLKDGEVCEGCEACEACEGGVWSVRAEVCEVERFRRAGSRSGSSKKRRLGIARARSHEVVEFDGGGGGASAIETVASALDRQQENREENKRDEKR
jgi:hypothetical protein